MRPVYN